jgi:CRP-like cAMP-binding protein
VFRRTDHNPPTLLATPLAEDIPHHELAVLDTISTPVRFPAGRAAMVENAVGRECMMVVEGSFIVERDGEHVAVLLPGDFMGEVALLAKRPRNATVTAAQDSTVYAFTPREFEVLLRDCPVLAARVLTDAVTRANAA